MNPEWYVDITVKRDAKRNARGDVVGVDEHTIENVLFDPGTSTNEPDRFEMPDDRAKLFFPENPEADIRNEDRVEFTAYGIDYKFGVAGHPLRYPKGCVVNLGE